MHEDIERMIDLVSQGETITKRQREIIRSRALSLGIDPDEAELLLEARVCIHDNHKLVPTSKRDVGTCDFHNSGCIYEGEMENGVAEGRGVVYYPHHYGVILYEGEFHKGNRHGTGVMFLDDGITKCYEGQWIDDEMSGKGIFYWEDGATKLYDGNHHDGYYEGKGILYDKTGQRFYEGDFHYSDFHGKGTIYKKGIKLCEGEFSEGRMIRGALFKNGLKIYDGPLPPTEDGLIHTGTRFNGSLKDCNDVLCEYTLGLKGNKYLN